MLKQLSFKKFRALLMGTTVILFAGVFLQPVYGQEKAAVSNKATLQYLGTKDNMYLFKVTYPNIKADKFRIEIKESPGDLLYEEADRTMGYSRHFLVPRSVNVDLSFVIRNLYDRSVQRFYVSPVMHETTDIVFRKVE